MATELGESSVSDTVTLTEDDIPGASLQPPFESVKQLKYLALKRKGLLPTLTGIPINPLPAIDANWRHENC